MVQPERAELDILENIRLADFTTLKLGGTARYFITCTTVPQIFSTLEYTRRNGIRVHVLGGGSNTIFRDEGFDGLVLKVALRGIHRVHTHNEVNLTVAAGVEWDEFVAFCIHNNLAGVECLSGIPGLVGATPIQNVGAYGQEVAETIIDVKAIERATLSEIHFSNNECRFTYRRSRFNADDIDKFLITEVTFRLKVGGEPQIRYPELKKYIASNIDFDRLESARKRLDAVRASVLALRRTKSMVIDANDANSRSVGSFFKNPVLTKSEFDAFATRCRAAGIGGSIPTFASGEQVKVPAAWLVENAGFPKGFRQHGVGVSTNHSLALVNIDGTTRELLALAEKIQATVFAKFGLKLEREPVVVM